METLTPRQAYMAMMAFLELYYSRGKSDEIGGLLGGLSLLADGGSADPAMLIEFNECVRKVLSGALTESDFLLRLNP